MMNDSVREELQTKVAAAVEVPSIETVKEDLPRLAPPPKPFVLETRVPRPPMVRRPETNGLTAPQTSPTLVDFQNKNTVIPEWRLQMQNAVRQRRGSTEEGGAASETNSAHARLATHGSAALKAETVTPAVAIPEIANADPRLNAALRRIEASRKVFSHDRPARPAVAANATPAKSFPFNVVAPAPNPTVSRPQAPLANAPRPAPQRVTPLRMEKKLDTNKLPRLESVIAETLAAPVVAVDSPGPIETAPIETPATEPKKVSSSMRNEFAEINRIIINADPSDDMEGEFESYDDEIEDLAPFSMRFNAGLFDLIIGIFASLVLLSPIAFIGGDWFTPAGVLMFAATASIVLFLYLTACIGFYGKTMGMRLFSLELVDAEENEYPSFRQAAVSSSLYLVGLGLAGFGFVTVFFNDERRAVHDLLSGTIIVREF